jgi:hypothetical protein
MHEEIKSRLNSGNVCYDSVQSLLSSRLLSTNVKVKIYKTVIMWLVLYVCETWSVTLMEEHRPRVWFLVLTSASIKIRAFWDIALSSLVLVDRCFRGAYCLIHRPEMEAVRTSETSMYYNENTRRNIPEGSNLQTEGVWERDCKENIWT